MIERRRTPSARRWRRCSARRAASHLSITTQRERVCSQMMLQNIQVYSVRARNSAPRTTMAAVLMAGRVAGARSMMMMIRCLRAVPDNMARQRRYYARYVTEGARWCRWKMPRRFAHTAALRHSRLRHRLSRHDASSLSLCF